MSVFIDRETRLLVQGLTGTNEAEAVKILTQAGFSALTDMDEAVRQAVARAAT